MEIAQYLQQLKEETGMSWGSLAQMTDLPVSTIRDIVNGNTKHPAIDAVALIVAAMGGSLDALAGVASQAREDAEPIQREEDAGGSGVSITVDTLRSIRVEMLEAQRTAYEQQIARMEDIHAQQLRQMREDYDRSDAYKTRMIRYLSIALAVLIVLVISVLVVDLLNRDVGWFRSMFSEPKMSNNRLSGIVDFARRILGGAA